MTTIIRIASKSKSFQTLSLKRVGKLRTYHQQQQQQQQNSLFKPNNSLLHSKVTPPAPSSASAAATALRSVAPIFGTGLSTFTYTATTKCETSLIALADEDPSESEFARIYQRALAPAKQYDKSTKLQRTVAYLKRALRMALRALKLLVTLTPVVAFYPVTFLSNKQRQLESEEDAHVIALSENDHTVDGPMGWYLNMCLRCVERSGAAVIKLMQWAGSRPDMFGHSFCSVFSRLQDDTTPHAWRHTERVLQEAYGKNWKDRIQINKDEILGSGCIGQVYKGYVRQGNDRDNEMMPVAVKVMHPSVEANIDADLDLMRLFVRAIQKLPWSVFGNLKWLNMEGAVEDFAGMLKLQLDCRVEAAHLEQFNENFADSKNVTFPKLVDGFTPTKDILIETFCQGVPVIKFAKENKENGKLLHEMCITAIQTVCKMIFLDNFMHGDLHPGNVLIDPANRKFVLLDVGIVTTYTEEDHTLLVDVLTSFLRKQGRQAGRLMIDSSNRLMKDSNDHAVDEERFIDKIEEINIKASTKGYLMENLGSYITFICNAAAKHHVMLNQAFISSALAVKIQEGIALALDPSVKVYKVATPILYESERRRGDVKDTVMKMIGLEKFWPFKKE